MNVRMVKSESFMVDIRVSYEGCLRPKIEQSRIGFIKQGDGFYAIGKANGIFSHKHSKPMDSIKDAVSHELAFILTENRNGYGSPNQIKGKTLNNIKLHIFLMEKNIFIDIDVSDIEDEFSYKYEVALLEKLDEYKIIKARD